MIALLLKTSIIIAVVFGFYKAVIEKESFFATNRIYFILGLALTFSLPFVSLPKLIENQGIVSKLIESKNISQKNSAGIPFNTSFPEVTSENIPIDISNASDRNKLDVTITPSERSLTDWIFFAYLFGVIILSINLLAQVLDLLFKVIRSKDKIHESDGIIINSQRINEPCSFFNYIFINPELYELEIYEQIIAHEKIHVKKKHSIDLLFSEIAIILLWFNPFIWLFRKEVEKNVEYQTDNILIDNQHVARDSYQLNLLKIATFKKPLTITTNYNQSLIKNRILKMNSKKSNPHSYWKYAFTVPLFFAVALLLNKPYTAYASQTSNKGITINDELDETPILNTNINNDELDLTNSDCKKLLEAIRTNDLNVVKALLKSTDINCIDYNPGYEETISNGNTWKTEKAKSPLFAAARTGNIEIAKLLVAKGVDIELIVQGDGVPIITAAEYGHFDFFKYLLDLGADMNRTFPNQGSALIVAAGNGHQEIVEFLVSKKVDINYYSPNQGNALILAASNGYTTTVKYLIEKGMDINFIAPNQGNALIAASSQGHLETVKYLLSKDADINKISPNHGNALIVASGNGHLEIVKYLMSKGASINKISPNQGNAVNVAANNGNKQTLNFLIEKGADINNQNDAYGSALNAAAKNGDNKSILLLLSKGANINAQTDGQGSALNAAARNGYLGTIKLLIAKGADINGQTEGQGSALNAAARNGNNETIKLLLSNGANIDLQNNGQGSALNAAAKNGHLDTVKLLISKGADINLFSEGKGTALSAASKNAHNDVIEYLISKGAKPTYEN